MALGEAECRSAGQAEAQTAWAGAKLIQTGDQESVIPELEVIKGYR